MPIYTAITQEGTVSLETRSDWYVRAQQDSNLRLPPAESAKKGPDEQSRGGTLHHGYRNCKMFVNGAVP